MFLYLTFPSASSLHVLSHDERGVKPLKISKCLSTTWKSFTDGTFEPDSEVPVSIGGLIVHSAVSSTAVMDRPIWTEHYGCVVHHYSCTCAIMCIFLVLGYITFQSYQTLDSHISIFARSNIMGS